MSFIIDLLNGASSVAAIVYPPAVPILTFVAKVEPYVEKAMPLIQAAIKEGPAALEAAKKSSPEFFGHLTTLANSLKASTGDHSLATESEVNALAAHIVGVDPPGWTHDETERWWDRAVDFSK